MAILREKATGRMVQQGDKLPDFRGEMHTVLDWYAKPAPSTGRVETDKGSFYPGVIGCELEVSDGR